MSAAPCPAPGHVWSKKLIAKTKRMLAARELPAEHNDAIRFLEGLRLGPIRIGIRRARSGKGLAGKNYSGASQQR